MARHTYHVTRRLLWIDDGHPETTLSWVGGPTAVYEQGSTILVYDREVQAICHCLEATDAAGRRVLERACATSHAPATVTPAFTFQPDGTVCLDTSPGSLHPTAYKWLMRAADEKLRQARRLLDLVQRILARGHSPTRQDLAAAVRQAGDARPPALQSHLALRAASRQRPGPKHPPRTTAGDLAIYAYYKCKRTKARWAHTRDSRQPRNVNGVAETATIRAFSISRRTVQRVVQSFAERPWVRDGSE